jgi:hypothetical protein
MSRHKIKVKGNGIDYFKVQVGMMDDSKIQKVIAKHSWKEVSSFLMWILPLIYGEEGFYYKWDEDSSGLYALKSNSQIDDGEKILETLLEKGFFNQMLYDKYKIVTSKGIQSRFAEAASRRVDFSVPAQYWLGEEAKNIILVSGDKNEPQEELNAQDVGKSHPVDTVYTESKHNVDTVYTESKQEGEVSKHNVDTVYTESKHNVDILPHSTVQYSTVQNSTKKNISKDIFKKSKIFEFSDFYQKWRDRFPGKDFEKKEFNDEGDLLPTTREGLERKWNAANEELKAKMMFVIDEFLEKAEVKPSIIFDFWRVVTTYTEYNINRFSSLKEWHDNERREGQEKYRQRVALQREKDSAEILSYIATDLKQVPKMQQQMTEKELRKLLVDYSKPSILKKLDDMDNSQGLLNKYTSVSKTCASWLANEFGESDDASKSEKELAKMFGVELTV